MDAFLLGHSVHVQAALLLLHFVLSKTLFVLSLHDYVNHYDSSPGVLPIVLITYK